MNNDYFKIEKKTNEYKNAMLKKIFIILISITVIQQMPIVKDYIYEEIRMLLYIGFIFLLFYSFLTVQNNIMKYQFQFLFIITIVYTTIFTLIVLLFSDSNFNFFEIIIPFAIFITSLKIKFTKKEINKLLIIYIILSIILGITSIFYYGEGFSITEIYFLSFKNQIGAILGIALTIILVWIFDRKQFNININFIVKLLMFFMLIISILVIRNRSALIAISIIFFMLFFKINIKLNYRKILFTLATLIIIIIIGFYSERNLIFDFIMSSFTSNYDVYDVNSISAGRVNVYIESFKYISDNFFLGELLTESYIKSIPHNYMINKWVNYGVLGSFPIILFYIYLWFFCIINIFKAKKGNFTLPFWVLLFSLIVSLFEYTYPYGPGVSQVMLWFLLGQNFNRNN